MWGGAKALSNHEIFLSWIKNRALEIDERFAKALFFRSNFNILDMGTLARYKK